MSTSKIPDDFRRVFLPYYFHPMTRAINERHDAELAAAQDKYKDRPWDFDIDTIYPRARANTFLPLNRRYKPLGSPLNEYVDYLDFPHLFVRFTINPTRIKNVWGGSQATRGEPTTEGELYLYYDNPATHRTYGERFGRLLNYINIDWRDIRGDRRTRFQMQEAGLAGA